jgi:hypothetical protein
MSSVKLFLDKRLRHVQEGNVFANMDLPLTHLEINAIPMQIKSETLALLVSNVYLTWVMQDVIMLKEVVGVLRDMRGI